MPSVCSALAAVADAARKACRGWSQAAAIDHSLRCRRARWRRWSAAAGEADALIGVSPDGALDVLGSFAGVGLVTLAAAVNHELGRSPIRRLVAAARAAGALLHVDAVQAAGKLLLADVDADALAISAHKLGMGLQGVGALAIAIDDGLPVVDGGHQERGRRPGTENTLGMVGFGAAAASDGSRRAGAPVAALGRPARGRPRSRSTASGSTAPGRRWIGGTVNAEVQAGARGERRS